MFELIIKYFFWFYNEVLLYKVKLKLILIDEWKGIINLEIIKIEKNWIIFVLFELIDEIKKELEIKDGKILLEILN